MRILGESPLLLDLAYGRVGAFVDVKTGQGQYPLTVEYTPPNSLFKVERIQNVPSGALIEVPKFHDRVPRPLCILVAGEFGHAPLLDNHLKMQIASKLKEMDELKRRLAIQTAAADEQKRIQERAGMGYLDEYLKKYSQIRKKIYGEGYDRSRFLKR